MQPRIHEHPVPAVRAHVLLRCVLLLDIDFLFPLCCRLSSSPAISFPTIRLRRSLTSTSPFFWPFMHFLHQRAIAMIGFFALALAFREEVRKRPFVSGLALSICLYKPTLLLLFLPMLLIT